MMHQRWPMVERDPGLGPQIDEIVITYKITFILEARAFIARFILKILLDRGACGMSTLDRNLQSAP